MSFHSGTPRAFAHRSQQAFVMAPSARCTTPLCGPTQRYCGSSAMPLNTRPKPLISSSMSRPTSCCPKWSMAATISSLPPPSVNARPVPPRSPASMRAAP